MAAAGARLEFDSHPPQVGCFLRGRVTFAPRLNSFSGICLNQVLVSDPSKLEQIRERETDITKERIQKVGWPACTPVS